jgi:hypothetical protein
MCLPPYSRRCESKACYVRKKRARVFRIHFSVRNLKPIVEIGNNFPAAVLCSVTPPRKRHGVFKFHRTALFCTPVITFSQSVNRKEFMQTKMGLSFKKWNMAKFAWSKLRFLTMLEQHLHLPKKLDFVWQRWDTCRAGFREREELISRHSAPHFGLVKTR